MKVSFNIPDHLLENIVPCEQEFTKKNVRKALIKMLEEIDHIELEKGNLQRTREDINRYLLNRTN